MIIIIAPSCWTSKIQLHVCLNKIISAIIITYVRTIYSLRTYNNLSLHTYVQYYNLSLHTYNNYYNLSLRTYNIITIAYVRKYTKPIRTYNISIRKYTKPIHTYNISIRTYTKPTYVLYLTLAYVRIIEPANVGQL